MDVSYNLLNRAYEKYKNEYDKAAIEVLESGWYILGKRLLEFENEFANFIGIKHAIGLNSGLDALVLAFRALDIKKGDEVIVPANTYIASILGITENNATPIFVEPDEFYNLDCEKIEDKITKNTKAILVVHLFGQAANMSKIKTIAEKHNLFLVEDCAQSHGAKFDNKTTGTWGDIGCFSFYPTKNLGAFGDSGAVVTNSESIYEKIHMMRNYGSKIKYQHELLGVNSRMDEIQAALLSVKLSHYNSLRNERAIIANRYLKEINNPLIILPKIRVQAEHVWHLFVIRTSERDRLQAYMAIQGIGTAIHYPIPPHLTKAYSYLGYSKSDLPITENFSDTILSIPLYEGMTNKEIDFVIKTLNNFK